MRQFKYWLLTIAGLLALLPVEAHINPAQHNKPNINQGVNFREDCTTPKAQIDQGVNRIDPSNKKVNNVRARLRTGGDPWWDGQDGKYVVPHVDEGEEEVSSIFAGGVWLGGVDPGGSLKVACQTYGNPSGQTDFWAGPLDPNDGTTDKEICERWDRFFEVYGTEIDEHLRLYEESVRTGIPYDPALMPAGVKGWPARGNEFFFEINEFDLPNTGQGLAGFYDKDGDFNYEPLDGEYPVIEIRGCDAPQYPDQMIFWIYNDNAGIHSETQGNPIQMEIQVQAFSYGTNDEINDMTFQRYKLINRAIEDIDSTYFAMWVDADLGCYTDDYIGCDTSRSLAYTYNADALDGQTGCQCPGGVATYCADVPILGVDYFRGPLRPIFSDTSGMIPDTFVEIGMSSFTYYNNGGFNNPPPGTTDPNIAGEYYNYLTGSWRDGSPFTFGDDAYQGTEPINYAFTEAPNVQGGWSMCEEDLPEYDRRTIQASGPFLLKPGTTNELIVGVVWTPDLQYPCPDITRLLLADDLAQNLFDNCFELTDGPDAPDVDFVELDRKLIAVLTNDTITSNNAFELYEENDLLAPALPDIDSTYNFEGYVLYQLADPTVARQDYDNPDKSRIVAIVDVKNGVAEIYNWTSTPSPNGEGIIWFPEIQVTGTDQGIRHTFEITEDQFAAGDRRLVNHKKYYFSAVAYAYNDWAPYDPQTDVGQKRSYLEGRFNIRTYTAIPRPIVDRNLNSDYGDGPQITRIDGVGVGGNFLDVTEETRQAIFNGTTGGELTYVGGRGPVNVLVYNPLEVVGGEFELTFVDENMTNSKLDDTVRWELRNLTDPSQPVVFSERSLDVLNEQIIAQYGFTLNIGQTDDVGDKADETNGYVGYEEVYEDATKAFWFSGVSNFEEGNTELNYLATTPGQLQEDQDPNQALQFEYFHPFQLFEHRLAPDAPAEYITPFWRNSNGSNAKDDDLLANVNNVDIVFTSNPDLWSRCVVVETANSFYTTGLGLLTQGNARQFDLRPVPSVSKVDNNGDGIPDPDNETAPDGTPRVGMGWFPGYAIDVETGKRLNIFFGENTAYDASIFGENYEDTTGLDMMFNPTSQLFLPTGTFTNIFNFIGGGQHFVYVSNTPYDACETLYGQLRNPQNIPQRVIALQNITWAGWPMMAAGTRMLPYSEGLIPNDLIVKLRVDNPYEVSTGTDKFNGYPTYRFTFDGLAPTAQNEDEIESALDMINVVPNPYYAYSAYETNQFNNIVKITNLPAKCVVTIYTLDGNFIRQYNRDETAIAPSGSNRGIRNTQILPDLEWDLKNTKAIPVAAGVYLIHIDAGELGERTIKWFGTNRQFDPSGL